MTQDEWDEKWWDAYNYLVQRAGVPPARAFEMAHDHMRKNHGYRPKGESSGPPFWMKLAAPVIGVPMDFIKKIWDWLNGRKVLIVALVAGIPVIVEAVGQVVCAATGGVCPATWTQIALTIGTVVAVLHRVLKYLGWSEEPKV